MGLGGGGGEGERRRDELDGYTHTRTLVIDNNCESWRPPFKYRGHALQDEWRHVQRPHLTQIKTFANKRHSRNWQVASKSLVGCRVRSISGHLIAS